MIYNLGRVVPLFKGTYDAATTYTFLDVVFYDNSSFVALDTTTGNLPTDTTHWLPVALKGITQDPTPAQMQEIKTEVEQYIVQNTIVDSMISTATDKSLSANMGNEISKQTYTVNIIGANDTLVSRSIYCQPNHSYRIYPDNLTPDFSGVITSSSLNLLFGINNIDFENNNVRLYRRMCDDKTSPLNEYYDVITDTNGYLTISMRLTEGESIKFYIEDITSLNRTIEEQISPITEEIFGYSENISNLYQNATGVFYNTPITFGDYTNISFRKINGRTHTAYIGATRLNELKNRGFVSVEIMANPEYDAYITFAIASTSSLESTPLTLQQLLTNHIISSVHSETAAFLVPAGTTQVFDIPEDCTNIFFTGVNYQQEGAPTEPPYRVPSNVRFFNNKQTLSEQINNLSEIKEDGWDEFEFNPTHYPMTTLELKENGTIENNTSYYSVQIPLYEAKYVKLSTKSGSQIRFNFLKERLESGTVQPATGYSATYYSITTPNTTKTYTVPSDAKYLYIYLGSLSFYFSSEAGFVPKSVVFYSKKNNPDTKTTGFEIGTVGIDGNIHYDKNYAVSGYVDLSRGFYMKFSDEYKVYSAHLYDMNGKLISYNYLPPTDNYFSYAYWLQDYSFYSIAYCIPYQMKIVVKRRDGQPITNTDNIVKQFVYLNDNRLHLENPDFDMQYYNNFRARIRQLSACIFNPVAKMPTTTTSSSVDGQPLQNMNTQYFREGQYRAGVDYSSNMEYSKAVGMEVSLKTYLSSIADKYSVSYTENLTSNSSKYGITYTSRGATDATGYYGIVCSSLVGYALNLRMLYRADYWYNAHPSKPEESVVLVENINGYNVKPGDLIWNSGHISVISEIYDDELGNRKFIVWSEQTKPSPYICAITPEEFNHRLEKYGYGTTDSHIQVMRYQNWDNVSTPCNFDIDIDMNDFFNANYIHEPIKNIQSFAGDYATFTKGDKVFFTVNIANGFTKFQVLDSTDTVVYEKNLSTLTASTIYPNATDWATLDYTSLSITGSNNTLSGGLYTARLIDNDGNVSESTHFEIVEITFPTPTKTGSTYNCTFSCSSNATPYLLRKEQASGYNTTSANNGTDYEFLDGTETSAALNWTITSTFRYIKLFCRGKYGTAVKKVDAYGL